MPVNYIRTFFALFWAILTQFLNRISEIIFNALFFPFRDATQMHRDHTLTTKTLEYCDGIKDDAWEFKWSKGLRMEESTNELETTRIKSQNFQLTMKPVNLEEKGSSSPIKNATSPIKKAFKQLKPPLKS